MADAPPNPKQSRRRVIHKYMFTILSQIDDTDLADDYIDCLHTQ
jgi:hypothetical protein